MIGNHKVQVAGPLWDYVYIRLALETVKNPLYGFYEETEFAGALVHGMTST